MKLKRSFVKVSVIARGTGTTVGRRELPRNGGACNLDTQKGRSRVTENSDECRTRHRTRCPSFGDVDCLLAMHNLRDNEPNLLFARHLDALDPL